MEVPRLKGHQTRRLPTCQNPVAVLPFANRSNREEDRFFTDGLHGYLLTQISRSGDIKTISQTSVAQYRDNPPPMPEIARELGVATILEGGVQRAGNQISIDVRLVDAVADTLLWSEIYTRELMAGDLFEIQHGIALAIAEEREPVQRVPTDSLKALEAYFRGTKTLTCIRCPVPRTRSRISSMHSKRTPISPWLTWAWPAP